MRNSIYFNTIWSEVIEVLRLRIFDFDLKQNWEVGSASAEVLLTSTVVPTLPLCLGENDNILNDHWAESKIQIINAGNIVNSREAVRILANSFERKLGRWAFDNASLINELNTLSALGALWRSAMLLTKTLRQQNILIFLP